MWQVVRDELRPLGFEIVSVAMDTNGVAAVGPHIEAANPTYPVLLDPEHSLGALLGIINVPMGVWIDEDGILVRPAEVCSYKSVATIRRLRLGRSPPSRLYCERRPHIDGQRVRS